MDKIPRSIDGLRTELGGIRDIKATIARLEEVRAELDEKATRAGRVRVGTLTEMKDLMRLSLDRLMVRLELMEARQILQDLNLEEFRSEVRVFTEGFHSNRKRIDSVEERVDTLESKSA